MTKHNEYLYATSGLLIILISLLIYLRLVFKLPVTSETSLSSNRPPPGGYRPQVWIVQRSTTAASVDIIHPLPTAPQNQHETEQRDIEERRFRILTSVLHKVSIFVAGLATYICYLFLINTGISLNNLPLLHLPQRKRYHKKEVITTKSFSLMKKSSHIDLLVMVTTKKLHRNKKEEEKIKLTSLYLDLHIKRMRATIAIRLISSSLHRRNFPRGEANQ